MTHPAPTPLSAGEVVLGRLGKHQFWPALASRAAAGAPASAVRLIFFGDRKELVVCNRDSRQGRPAIRPFGDLDSLTSRERSNSELFRVALEEAERWRASAGTAAEACSIFKEEEEAPEEGEGGADGWKINGEVVPRSLVLRAAALKLPRWDAPAPMKRPSLPVASFRVVAPPALLSPTGARPGGGASTDGEAEGASEPDDDDTFDRRHAAYEDLEYRGFAAHPDIGSHSHDDEHDDDSGCFGSWPTTWPAPLLTDSSCIGSDGSGSPCAGGAARRKRKAPEGGGGGGGRGRKRKSTGGSAEELEALVGQLVRVPTLAFPSLVLPSSATPFYDGRVTRVERVPKKKPMLEVYFSGDHTTCLFAHAQVLTWLVTPAQRGGDTDHPPPPSSRTGAAAAAASAAAPQRTDSHASKPTRRTSKERDSGESEEEGVAKPASPWRSVAIKLAGALPLHGASREATQRLALSECPLLDQILTMLPLRASREPSPPRGSSSRDA